jgi:molybdopterin-guanine dinucleotide biosynthesis protein A
MYDPKMDGYSAIAAFIVAGGKSTRMGKDKASISLAGRTLLEHALVTARGVTPEVRIVGDPEKFSPFAPTVEDVFRDCGPLGGIHAALRASRAELNLMLAVDVPFISSALLQYLLTRARSSDSVVTVPRVNQRRQPLCAVYRRAFADIAEQALQEGRYKIDALFDPSSTQVVEEEDLEAAGFSPRMFRNVNTPEELEQASKEIQTNPANV